MNSEITGIFLSFDEKELADIKRRLDLIGYKPDAEGLKKLILEALCDSEGEEETEGPADRLIRSASEYIHQNPEKIVMGIAAIKNIAKMIKRKK